MNSSHKGFIAPLLLILIAVLLIGGGTYVYMQKQRVSHSTLANSTAQVTSQATTSTAFLKDLSTITSSQTYIITWVPTDLATQNVLIELFSADKKFIGFLANTAPNNGSYSWTVDPTLSTGPYYIDITDDGSMGPDTVDHAVEISNFSIISASR